MKNYIIHYVFRNKDGSLQIEGNMEYTVTAGGIFSLASWQKQTIERTVVMRPEMEGKLFNPIIIGMFRTD